MGVGDSAGWYIGIDVGSGIYRNIGDGVGSGDGDEF